MPPKSQVEKSPHREEIHEMLLKNISCREISKHLKDEYGEIINYRAICRYAQKHIKLEEKVTQRVNEKLDAQTENAIKEETNAQVSISKKTDYVVEVNADNMIGVIKVAAELVPEFEKAKKEADNPEIKNVNHTHTARISLDANKVVNDYNKSQDTNIEVNINGQSNRHRLTKEQLQRALTIHKNDDFLDKL